MKFGFSKTLVSAYKHTGVTREKTDLEIFTAVITSNLGCKEDV
jgi:hypothetical protein